MIREETKVTQSPLIHEENTSMEKYDTGNLHVLNISMISLKYMLKLEAKACMFDLKGFNVMSV